jgi:hypothetical protein
MDNEHIYDECLRRIPFYQKLEERYIAGQTWFDGRRIVVAYLDEIRNTLGRIQRCILLQKRNPIYQERINQLSQIVFKEELIARTLLGPCFEGKIPERREKIKQRLLSFREKTSLKNSE